MLNEKQIKKFKDDGFVLIPGLFNSSEVNKILKYTEELQKGPEISGKEWKYFEESKINEKEKVLARIENFCKYHKGFHELCTRSRIMDCVNDCFGEQGILFKDKINFKMPGGSGFTPHQDSQAGWDDYAKFYLTAMVSVDKATIKNGCLWVNKGGHKGPLRKLFTKENGKMIMKKLNNEPFPATDKILEVKKGTLVLLHGRLPHYSCENKSLKSRHAYTTHIIDGSALYPDTNWLQRPNMPLKGFVDE